MGSLCDAVIGDMDFWVYCQPVGFYNLLARRRKDCAHSKFLDRCLSYVKRPPPPPQAPRDFIRLDLSALSVARPSVPGGSAASLIVALCETIPKKEEFRPVTARLVRLGCSPSGTTTAAVVENGAGSSNGLHHPPQQPAGGAGGTDAAATAAAAAARCNQEASSSSSSSSSSSAPASAVVLLPLPSHDMFEPKVVVMAWEPHLDIADCLRKQQQHMSAPPPPPQQHQQQQNGAAGSSGSDSNPGRRQRQRQRRRSDSGRLSVDMSRGKVCGLIPHGSNVVMASLPLGNGCPVVAPMTLRPSRLSILRKVLTAGKQQQALYTFAQQQPVPPAAPPPPCVAPDAVDDGTMNGSVSGSGPMAAAAASLAAAAPHWPVVRVTVAMTCEGGMSILTQTPLGIARNTYQLPRSTALAAAPKQQGGRSDGDLGAAPPAEDGLGVEGAAALDRQASGAGPSGGTAGTGGGGGGAGSLSLPPPSLTLSSSDVVYKYVYSNNNKYVAEHISGLGCAFCYCRCRSYRGLQLHLLSCHDLFEFRFGAQPGDGRPVVMVRVPLSVYDIHGVLTRPAEDRDPTTGALLTSSWWYARGYRCPGFLAPEESSEAGSSQLGAGDVPLDVLLPPAGGADGEARYRYCPDGSSQDYMLATGTHGGGGRGGEPPGGSFGPRKRLNAKRTTQHDAAAAAAAALAAMGQPQPGGSGLRRRLYFHAKTVMPMLAEEMPREPDSDDETDEQEWVRCVQRDLLSHKDITSSERQFMLLWNTYHHHRPVAADYLVPVRCAEFATHHAAQLAADHQLRQCFVVHLLLLWDFALIDGPGLERCIAIVDGRHSQQPGDAEPAAAAAAATATAQAPVPAASEAGAATTAGVKADS